MSRLEIFIKNSVKHRLKQRKAQPADTRTPAQRHALLCLLRTLCADYPQAEIVGHRDLPWVRKDCPCFDARAEYADL
ncbi:MAG: N-acetylmuramoyl-L-alanine amidase [Prevotella sp.]|nr:N-acetylmuramoyl-L-alanine amidase [Prevotella sp.]